MPDRIQVLVDGVDYGGWETVRIQEAIEQLAGFFELSVSDKWAGQPVSRPILAGSICEISLNGETVITGFIDEVETSRDPQNHSITFRGRDATGDLADCVVLNISQVTGLKLDKIAQRFCKPFGIGVVVEPGVNIGDPWPGFGIVCGEKLYATLNQIARARGVLLTSDGLGNLVLGKPGTTVAPTTLQVGKNVLMSKCKADLKERFSEYHVYTQAPGAGLDVPPSMNNEAISYDSQMKKLRYRPTATQGEFALNLKYSQQYANWLRNTTASRSQTATYTVNGWAHKSGVWRKNTLVQVVDPDMNLNEQRLISVIARTLDPKNGSRTEITTVGKHAFDQLAEPNDLIALENAA